jgi:hypothetical protein
MGPVGWGDESLHHLQGGGLAGAVRPEYGKQLTRRDIDAHVIDSGHFPVALGQVLGHDRAHHTLLRPYLRTVMTAVARALCGPETFMVSFSIPSPASF